jgi:hypothetical protein
VAKRKPARKPPPKRAASLRELASLLGVSRTSTSNWSRDPRWPFGRSGPYDPVAVKAWAARTLAPNPAAESRPPAPELTDDASGGDSGGGADPIRNIARATSVAKLQLLVKRASKIEVETLIAKREYVPRAEMQERQEKREHAIITSLKQLPEALAPALAMKSAEEVRRTLDHAIRNLCNLAFGTDSSPPGGHSGGSGGDPQPPPSPARP